MSILTAVEEVLVDEMDVDVEAISALAAEDQALAEARTAAKALGQFWEHLPGDMSEELRAQLVMRWQSSQFRWSSFDDDWD